MKLGVLFSGGKDSTLALFKAMKENEISCLISIFPKKDDSYMFHYPNIHLTKLQAKAMDIPIIAKDTEGKKEEELKDLEEAISNAIKIFGIEGVVTGAVRSNYQYQRIEMICKKLGLKLISPLWQKKEEEILNEILKNKFEVIITGIAAYPLTKDFLGKKLTQSLISKLKELNKKYGVSLVGEGGEFETLVLDAPFFKKKIVIEDFEITYKNYRGFLLVKKSRLVPK